MTTHGSRYLLAALGLLVFSESAAAGPVSKGADWRLYPPYKVMVALQVNASFVRDAGMRIADLAFSATFDDVVLGAKSSGGRFGIVPAGIARGKLWLTRHQFCDVQGAGERQRPYVKEEWPTEFPAQLVAFDLTQELDGGTAEDMPTMSLPELGFRFTAAFGVNRLQWFWEDGSASLDSMTLEFKAPWADIKAGKPVTIELPYETDDKATRGKWWIELTPKRQPKRGPAR